MSVAFWITTLVIVATPGTGVLYTVAAGLARGRRAAVVAAAGCTLGIVPHLAAAITGLAAVLHAGGVAYQVLRYLGAGYLLYLSWRSIRDRGGLVPVAGAPRSALRVVSSGILVNLLNPKLTLFFFAFLPQFVGRGDPHYLLRMLQLSGVFMLVTLVLFTGYGLLAAGLRGRLVARPAILLWLRRSFAGCYAALAGRLVLSSR